MPYVRIWVHLIWATKNRCRIIDNALKPKLLHHIIENAREKNIYLDQINGTEDHIHLLLSLGASQSISKVVFMLKGESSHWVNRSFNIHSRFEWQDEYIAVSVSESQVGKVRAYIKNQEEHHRHNSFSEEYEKFIRKYGLKSFG